MRVEAVREGVQHTVTVWWTRLGVLSEMSAVAGGGRIVCGRVEVR